MRDSFMNKIVNSKSYFLTFPGMVNGPWRASICGGITERVDYEYYMIQCSCGFALFSWTVQPDGRYWEDEYGFGRENEDRVVLYAYINENGEFVTPFADFHYRMQLESLEEFQKRIDNYMKNSFPDGFELWVSNSVKRKVDRDGHYKPFCGSRVVFPLKKEIQDRLDVLQQKLNTIRKEMKQDRRCFFIADAIEKEKYHITLHDFYSGTTEDTIKAKVRENERHIRYVLKQIQKMSDPVIKVEPVGLYNMNNEKLVLGFQAASEKDQEKLMMVYELFQTIVELEDYTPHVTLCYFYPGKHKETKVAPLKNLIYTVNKQIEDMKASGEELILELNVKDLVYQYDTELNG